MLPVRIDILTLFPGMFQGPLSESILGRASAFVRRRRTAADKQDDKLLSIQLHDLRIYGLGKYHQVDDSPYGGGAGMVLRVDVVVEGIESVVKEGEIEISKLQAPRKVAWPPRGFKPSSKKAPSPKLQGIPRTGAKRLVRGPKPHRIYFSPKGRKLTQAKVERLAQKEWLILLCGHYEGIDQRIIDGGWIDEEISIGDYVLTGGELPAMVLIDAVARQIPGVLGKEESASEESFSKALERRREYSHYTRPEEFRGFKVPDVLLSGHHAEIERWRKRNLR